jgi:hypothetical protein
MALAPHLMNIHVRTTWTGNTFHSMKHAVQLDTMFRRDGSSHTVGVYVHSDC